jgi:hypothetical protein
MQAKREAAAPCEVAPYISGLEDGRGVIGRSPSLFLCRKKLSHIPVLHWDISYRLLLLGYLVLSLLHLLF